MLVYEDGTQPKVGDVVMGHRRPARYIVVGFDNDSAKLLTIGTVVKGDAPLLGKTIFVQPGFTHSVPLSGLVRLGYAEITIGKDSAPSDEVEFDAE
jgi:hypothetical protein